MIADLFTRFEKAQLACLGRRGGSSEWLATDAPEFQEFHSALLPYAKAGDPRAQAVIASIHLTGLLWATEAEWEANFGANLREAEAWWVSAAARGHWESLDNLVRCGRGAEALRAKAAFEQLSQSRPDLVDQLQNAPVHGPRFFKELCRQLYGVAIDWH
jgi:hypothetical protein